MKYECAHHKLPQKYTRFGSSRLPVDKDGNLYYHLANWGTDMDRYHQIGIISNVFAEWQKYFIPWEFKSTSDFDSAQWYIYWVKGNKVTMPNGDVWNVKDRGLFDFTSNPDTLAVQYASPNLLCLINDDHDYSFTTAGPNSFDLKTVLLHECAHGFGIGHTDERTIAKLKTEGNRPIMAPYYDKHATITRDEEQAILDIHGSHLFEFAKHTTVLRIKKLFGDNEPTPLVKNKRGFLARIISCAFSIFGHKPKKKQL